MVLTLMATIVPSGITGNPRHAAFIPDSIMLEENALAPALELDL